MEGNKSNSQLVYQLEGRPNIAVALPLGMQHVMAMFTSNLAPILIIAGVCGLSGADTVVMVQCAMFVSGLTTFIQLYPIRLGKNRQIGANLPIVMGTSFAFVPTAQSVAAMGGIGMVLGGAMIGSLTEVIMGFFYKYIRKFFPPLVVGCTLVTIGVSLLNVGVGYFAGGVGSPDYGSPKNLAMGFLSLFVIIILQKFGKGIIKNSAILIGLIVGYIVSAFLGMVNTQPISEASWFRVPLPMHFKIEFSLPAIISFAVLYITSGLETIGNTSGITIAGFDREATEKETSGAILADALGSTTAAFFNCLPNTAFGQNAGIVSMTKVVNKFCIATGAFVLMLCGFFPKLGAVFSAIPSSVLGGSIITVFAMILINGIKMIAKAGFSERNIVVMGITFALGLGIANHQDAIASLPSYVKFIFHDTVSATCIISIVANLIFPADKESKPEDYNA
ncbi:uracil-xanthine permease family protein [Brachyspira pilosicoli]|uniref:uracil-xanthine permease family protein n=1 Tax=Brachyspira pilosicoli TaxID=52584 RepID=UPI001C66D54B|nr:nucleobase:cation symporter-2 family protein [Brachyspira pilosicoli]MBW5397604.1 purine permease [Brachyspira pilosicoli]